VDSGQRVDEKGERGRGRRHGLDVLCVVPLIAVFKIKSIRNNT
jgi:hypothetical protein